MLEHLLANLPESALATRQLYDPVGGGYHVPLRGDNRHIALDEVESVRAAHPVVQNDNVEVPVADLLYSLVVNTRSELVLETGASRGFSTVHLAAGVSFNFPETGRVLSLDIAPAPNQYWQGSVFEEYIDQQIVDSISYDPTPFLKGRQFDILFLDSLHNYTHLTREIMHFVPHLKVGGLIILHDSFFYDSLSLVALQMAQFSGVEAINIPTHRNGEGRTPGLSIFRTLRRFAPGEMLFPSLDGIFVDEPVMLPDVPRVLQSLGQGKQFDHYQAKHMFGTTERFFAQPPLLDPADGR